jgi:hypothetical protein
VDRRSDDATFGAGTLHRLQNEGLTQQNQNALFQKQIIEGITLSTHFAMDAPIFNPLDPYRLILDISD